MKLNSTKICCAIVAAAAILAFSSAFGCTSMLVSAKMSASGRPLMWKHRDTGAETNFIERVEAAEGRHAYVALFNGGDTLLAEAWMGMNDAGFAIMNTASYNLMPDTAKFVDQEGLIMSQALATCVTVDDFACLLDSASKPMGVQANFGVMDALGGLAYFETDDNKYSRFDVADDPNGFILRTNHSMTGKPSGGYGYVRYQNALDILSEEIALAQLSPMAFTEKVSRSFWHSLLKKDFLKTTDKWVVDQDFIPRNISTSSIVIEGCNSADNAEEYVMWTAIGYPPVAVVQKVTMDSIPAGLRPIAPNYTSPDCNDALALKKKAFPHRAGNGQKYIDMEFLRPIIKEKHALSMKTYNEK